MKKIGAGGFSIVYLARKNDECKYYSIKVIDKQLMIEKDKKEVVYNERNILSQVSHLRIVKLFYALQNVNIV